MKARPNILYIHSHDTGRYVQPMGHAVATPNLQRLAEQGVLFRQAFCANPTCSPSRASLLTGQCAHRAGMFGLAHRGFAMRDYGQLLTHTLRAAGYATTLIGVQHVASGDDVQRLGYDQIVPLDSNRADHVAPAAERFLASRPRLPFFLDVGFGETHRAFGPPQPADDPRFCLPPPTLPDTPDIRRDVAALQSSARRLDQGIGRVLAALEHAGLAQDTLVICTTDHGIAFPGMKCSLTDHGIGVFLILRGPGGFTGGGVVDAMVSHIDLFPTVCQVAGLDAPAWLEGRSLCALVRGEAAELHDAIFAEVNYHAAYQPMRAVRTRRWKYIRQLSDRARPVPPNCDGSPGKDLWLAHDWRDRPVPREQLFDLVFDPGECANLAQDAAHAGVLNEMRRRLDDWMRATDDPFLHARVLPAPPGARTNDPDGTEPTEPTRVVPPPAG